MMQVDPTLEAQLRTLEESHLRHEVRASPDAMKSLLADDFVELGSSGRVFDRATVLASLATQAGFQSRIEQFSVRLLAPGVALTTYRLSTWSQSEEHSRVTLRSSVWTHRVGRWVMVFHQGTPVPSA